MKKLFGILAISLFAALFVAPQVSANGQTADGQVRTDVRGVVTDNGTPLDGAWVIIKCDGHGQATQTDSDGAYAVSYEAFDCPAGSTVTVTASYYDKSCAGSGTATPISPEVNEAIINLNCGAVAAVPEFGTVIGMAALAGGAGAMFVIRKRQQTSF